VGDRAVWPDPPHKVEEKMTPAVPGSAPKRHMLAVTTHYVALPILKFKEMFTSAMSYWPLCSVAW